MSSGGCRPEVAARIVQILTDALEVLDLHGRSVVPEAPPKKTQKPPKPKVVKPRQQPPRPSRAQQLEEERARRRERARELFRAGHSLGAIAIELGVTPPTVAADVADLRVRQRRLHDPDAIRARREEFAGLFRAGWSISKIAAHFGLSPTTVSLDLRACGIRPSDAAAGVSVSATA